MFKYSLFIFIQYMYTEPKVIMMNQDKIQKIIYDE